MTSFSDPVLAKWATWTSFVLGNKKSAKNLLRRPKKTPSKAGWGHKSV
jgi:hypothetical protein